MLVITETSIAIAAPQEVVFDYATAVGTFPEVFRGHGPIAAIDKVEMKDGAPVEAGAVRIVHNADGSIFEEDVLRVERPHRHVYRLARGFVPPFSLLIRWGEGDWTFSAEENGTKIVWKYTFQLTSPLVYPVGALVVQIFLHKAMAKCLEAIKERVEAAASKPAAAGTA